MYIVGRVLVLNNPFQGRRAIEDEHSTDMGAWLRYLQGEYKYRRAEKEEEER